MTVSLPLRSMFYPSERLCSGNYFCELGCTCVRFHSEYGNTYSVFVAKGWVVQSWVKITHS